MPMLWIGVVLMLCKWLEVGPVADLSWWWVLMPLGLAFLWFEIVEGVLGFDKKKKMTEMDKIREERIAREYEMLHKKRPPKK